MSASAPHPPPVQRLGPPGIRGLPLIVALGALVTLIGVVVLLGSGAGYRFGVWQLGMAAGMMWAGAWICLFGALVSILAAVMTRPGTPYRGFTLAIAAALIGLAGFGSLVYWRYTTTVPLPSHANGPTARNRQIRPSSASLRQQA